MWVFSIVLLSHQNNHLSSIYRLGLLCVWSLYLALSRAEQTFRIQEVYAFTHHMRGISTYTCVHVLWRGLLLGTDPKDSAPAWHSQVLRGCEPSLRHCQWLC